jgi:hypothetical protein
MAVSSGPSSTAETVALVIAVTDCDLDVGDGPFQLGE